jgi:hypothetical protein
MAWRVRQLFMFSESNPNSINATTAAAAAGFAVSCELFWADPLCCEISYFCLISQPEGQHGCTRSLFTKKFLYLAQWRYTTCGSFCLTNYVLKSVIKLGVFVCAFLEQSGLYTMLWSTPNPKTGGIARCPLNAHNTRHKCTRFYQYYQGIHLSITNSCFHNRTTYSPSQRLHFLKMFTDDVFLPATV